MTADLRPDLRERVERDIYDLYGPVKWVRSLLTRWARDLQAAEANLKTALADLGDERVRCLTARREAERERDENYRSFCEAYGYDPARTSKVLLSWEREAEGAGPQPKAATDQLVASDQRVETLCASRSAPPSAAAPTRERRTCGHGRDTEAFGSIGKWLHEDGTACVSPPLTRAEFDVLVAKVDALDVSDELQDEQIDALRDLALALAEAMYHTTWTVKYQADEERRAALAALKGAHERIRDLAAKVREGR